MSDQASKSYEIPQADRVALSQKILYSIPAIALIPGMQIIDRIAQVVLNMGLGISPTLVGLAMAIFRIWDGFTDPYFGNLSDNYRSKWGRRRPFMVVGGVLCGLSFPLMWFMSRDWETSMQMAFFIVMGLIYYTALTVYTVPYFSIVAEMTPDTHERTNVIALRSLVFTVVTAPLNYLAWFVTLPQFKDELEGVRWLSILTALAFFTFGVIPMLKMKEPFYEQASRQEPMAFWEGFKVTVRNRLFVVLVSMKLLMTLGMQTVGTLGFYVSVYYVFAGDKTEAGLVAGTGGLVGMGLAAATVPLFAWLSKKFGKIRALYINSYFFLLATLSQWFLVTPDHPYWQVISAAMVGPAVTAIWIILPSMQTDVIDEDELLTGKRREGSFSAIMGWIEKLGFALSVVLAGLILDVSGFDVSLPQQAQSTLTTMRALFVFFPIVMAGAMIWLIRYYPLDEARCLEIRRELEARRGLVHGTGTSD